MREKLVKPPIGLCPKNIWERKIKVNRMKEVKTAIEKYYNAELKINIEWINEYNELIDFLKIN